MEAFFLVKFTKSKNNKKATLYKKKSFRSKTSKTNKLINLNTLTCILKH